MIENGKKPKVDDLKQLNKFWYKTSFENNSKSTPSRLIFSGILSLNSEAID